MAGTLMGEDIDRIFNMGIVRSVLNWHNCSSLPDQLIAATHWWPGHERIKGARLMRIGFKKGIFGTGSTYRRVGVYIYVYFTMVKDKTLHWRSRRDFNASWGARLTLIFVEWDGFELSCIWPQERTYTQDGRGFRWAHQTGSQALRAQLSI